MNDKLIKCPHCGQSFELSDALRHEVEEQVLATERAKYQKIELQLRQEKNALEEKQRAFDLEMQRQLDAERNKIRVKTQEEDQEKFRLKDKEKEKLIEDLKKSLEEAQRKASVGSQQLQGEIQELDLESTLRLAFPGDLVEPIAKGTLGADIRHIIRSPKGADCGVILWESKRTKAWSDSWLSKLKADLVADSAHIPALVSDVLPEEFKSGLGAKDGVWICLPTLFIPLAQLLRKSLLDAARQKAISVNMQDKSQLLYAYVTSDDFTNQVQQLIETYVEMKAQISRERAALEKNLKSREVQVERLISGMSNIVGSLPIKILELN